MILKLHLDSITKAKLFNDFPIFQFIGKKSCPKNLMVLYWPHGDRQPPSELTSSLQKWMSSKGKALKMSTRTMVVQAKAILGLAKPGMRHVATREAGGKSSDASTKADPSSVETADATVDDEAGSGSEPSSPSVGDDSPHQSPPADDPLAKPEPGRPGPDPEQPPGTGEVVK